MTWPEDDIAAASPRGVVEAFRVAARLGSPTPAELETELGGDPAAARHLVALGLAELEDGRLRLRSPEPALARRVSAWGERVRDEAEEARALLAATPALAAAWRESFERDAAAVTIDRVDADAEGWFGWWRYLVEHGGDRVCAVATNLDALGLVDEGAPGHVGRLLAALREGALSLELIVPTRARVAPAAVLLTVLADAGARVRVDDAAGWFAVAPGRVALVPETWGLDRDVAALVVQAAGIVGALEALFLARWEAAAEWGAPLGGDPVIELLCEGLADAEVASRLGISVRSVRRRVAAALERHGVTSRMALAHRLGRDLRP